MKRKVIIALLLAASVLVSCGKVPEETEEETEEETTTTVEETTEETTTTSTHRPTAMPIPSPSISLEPDYICITSNGEPYEEYLVTDFTFSEDGSSGTFTVERYISMTPDEVASLREGDIIFLVND